MTPVLKGHVIQWVIFPLLLADATGIQHYLAMLSLKRGPGGQDPYSGLHFGGKQTCFEHKSTLYPISSAAASLGRALTMDIST